MKVKALDMAVQLYILMDEWFHSKRCVWVFTVSSYIVRDDSGAFATTTGSLTMETMIVI